MQLKRQVEWGIHCCLTLAELPTNEFLSAGKLAALYRLPKPYLAKTLQALSRAGLLGKAMGPDGGYCLAKHESQIFVLDIVEAIEGTSPSFIDTGIGRRARKMDLASSCPVNEVMMAADQEWRSVLGRVSLRQLRSTLEPSTRPP
ncbi:RrF2 family transcriptional regulator [Endobacterium cereale]|uniref:RrF2 family transcriptional regulator n=1 Tax=Endobacterium cereale TaxID=2663029 RepID=UPI00397AB8DB